MNMNIYVKDVFYNPDLQASQISNKRVFVGRWTAYPSNHKPTFNEVWIKHEL